MIDFITETPCTAAAVRKLNLIYDNIMAEPGLRSTQYSISGLERSARSRAPTPTELAEEFAIE
jgi:hypothetical protein